MSYGPGQMKCSERTRINREPTAVQSFRAVEDAETRNTGQVMPKSELQRLLTATEACARTASVLPPAPPTIA